MNVLIVDDEELALKLLETELKKIISEKEKLFLANQSVKAIDIATNNKIDLAFLDIEMPIMDGITLAKKLKEINKRINIVFCTSHPQYALAAYDVYPSGYLLKPVIKEDIEKALNNLRFPTSTYKSGIYAKTFPNFDFYYDGTSLNFPRKKSKELLAYLIALNGGGATKKEICAILFEDEPYSFSQQDYFNKIYRDLKITLEEHGISDILIKKRDYYAIDKTKINCDYYEYLKGNPEAINEFIGEFMNQYSWSLLFTPNLY